MFETIFKNIDDILHKDAGCGSELDCIEQTSWILFLKYLDSRVEELDNENLPALLTRKYQSLEDAKNILGDVKNITHMFVEFQKYLYQKRVA